MKTYKAPIASLKANQIFVFGSNTEGRHGKGAALWAKENAGAIYGRVAGWQNKSYAIITKDLTKKIHPSVHRNFIISQIERLYSYATNGFEKTEFLIAYSGDGVNLNGYSPKEMAQMFIEAGNIPENIIFEEKFAELIKTLNNEQYSDKSAQ